MKHITIDSHNKKCPIISVYHLLLNSTVPNTDYVNKMNEDAKS